MVDLGAVDWQQVGVGLGTAAAAAFAALTGARRMWRKGLGDLLRPVVQAEVSEAVRTSMHQEIARLRKRDRIFSLELGALQDRVARMEGAVEAHSNILGGNTAKPPPK